MSRGAKVFLWVAAIAVALWALLRWTARGIAAVANPDAKLPAAPPPWASVPLSASWTIGLTPTATGPSSYFSWYELNKAMAAGGVKGIGPESTWNAPPPWADAAGLATPEYDEARASALGRMVGRLYLVRVLAVKSPLYARTIVERPGYMLALAEAGKTGPSATQIVAAWDAALEVTDGTDDGAKIAHPPAEVIADAGRQVFIGPNNVTEEF